MKTLTIRLKNNESKALKSIIDNYSGLNTASKAIVFTMMEFEQRAFHTEKFCDRIEELENKVIRLESIIEGARASAAALLDRTAQSDIEDA